MGFMSHLKWRKSSISLQIIQSVVSNNASHINSMQAAFPFQKQRIMFRVLNLVFFLVFIETTQATKDSPKLTDFPKIKRSFLAWPADTALSLKCKAEGAEPLKVRWFKNGRALRYSRTIWQDSRWFLRFRKPKLSDNGVYTCVVSNALGVVKHSYSLRILQRMQSAPVLIPGYPRSLTARAGDSVQLECLEEPNGRVSDYRWLKSDSEILNDPVMGYKNGSVSVMSPSKYESFTTKIRQRKFPGVKLYLDYVSEDDEGFYTCFLSNNIGFTHGTAYLNVTPILPTDPPEFLVPKHKRQQFFVHMERKDIKLSCLVRGGAPLKYQWFFNGQELSADERHEIDKAEMTIKDARVSDIGIYTCLIRNDFGSIKHNFELHVHSRGPAFPRLLPGYPKSKTGIVGQTVSLYCAEIRKGALIDYRWLKWHGSRKEFTKEELMNTSLYSVVSPEYNEIPSFKKGILLKLNNLTIEDQGLYTCLVSNHVGYTYQSAFISVKNPVTSQVPVFPRLLPGYPKSKTGIVGQTVSLYCAEVRKDALMNYSWLKWHGPRKGFTKEELTNTSLFSVVSPAYNEIPSFKKGILLKLNDLTMEDEGLYTCLVSNNVGYTYQSAFLSVKYPVETQNDYPVAGLEVTKSNSTMSCPDYQRTLSGPKKDCENMKTCASIYDEKTNDRRMFCSDQSKLCKQHGISGGGCSNATIESAQVILCCCVDKPCAKPGNKYVLKSENKTSSATKPRLMTLIFVLTLVLTFAVMLALLVYRLRQRKAAFTENIIHQTTPSRKSTKRMIMETKWLKEDI